MSISGQFRIKIMTFTPDLSISATEDVWSFHLKCPDTPDGIVEARAPRHTTFERLSLRVVMHAYVRVINHHQSVSIGQRTGPHVAVSSITVQPVLVNTSLN